MSTRFVKMHGCGNDFVIFDERTETLALSTTQVATLAHRHTGIGCDQLICMEAASGADVFMRIRNRDGSEAGACGNATRCVADILMKETGRSNIIVRTISGDLTAERLPDGLIQVNMGQARWSWDDIPLAYPLDTLSLELPGRPAAVSMGNPHITFFVDDLAQTGVPRLGPLFETDRLFPNHTNVGFAQILDRDLIRLKVWERGAGLTLACGSGACATLVNAHRRGLADRKATIRLDGGELRVEWRNDGDVLMTGPTATAFTGHVELP